MGKRNAGFICFQASLIHKVKTLTSNLNSNLVTHQKERPQLTVLEVVVNKLFKH